MVQKLVGGGILRLGGRFYVRGKKTTGNQRGEEKFKKKNKI